MEVPPAHIVNPWLALGLGLAVYMVFALAAATVTRWIGRDLRAMKDRSGHGVLLVGAAANLGILAATLLLLRWLDRSPVGALGLGFDSRDIMFSAVALALIAGLAWAFVWRWSKREGIRIDVGSPTRGTGRGGMILGWSVLAVVALQEEFLFRGYMTLNLRAHGPLTIVVVTTILFVAIHVPTNRADAFQLAGWSIGGAVLSWAYLTTGSIWVPVLLHFGTDMVNLLLFDIVGRSSVLRLTPPLTARHRARYRVVYALVLVTTLLVFYGPHVAGPG